jgi:nitroreductase
MNEAEAKPEQKTRADEIRRAFDARYGGGAGLQTAPWSATIGLLLSHRSVRAYRPDQLPADTLETLIAAAQSAATSSNLQTWSAVAVTRPDLKAELARAANRQRHVEQCPLFLVWLADLSRLERTLREEGAPAEALPFLEVFLTAAIDAALAAQNAVVAAESLGLSTVYIGALRNDPERVAEILALPSATFALFGLCVGYAANPDAGAVKPRLPQAAVLHREQYSVGDERALRAAYDAELEAFSRRVGMGAQNWTGRVKERIGAPGSLHGRERLKPTLRRLGFPLR